MESEETIILRILFEKSVNLSLIKSLKHCSDYNVLVSNDINRRLTLEEFKRIKAYQKTYIEKNYN